jgi:pyruvate/2-oxoglutarate dehydrogenase complex dihydrolipoamide acyltransferase (E2) component
MMILLHRVAALDTGRLRKVDYPITQYFDPPSEPGTDYGTPIGTPIYAPVTGTAIVMDTGNVGWGKSVQVQTGLEQYGAGHLSQFNVKNGQTVRVGDLIGWTGNSGNSTGPHVELFYRVKGVFADPTQVPGLINAFFTGHGTGVFGGTGTATPGTATSGVCQTVKWTSPSFFGQGGDTYCMDPVIGMVAIIGGGILLLGGIAVLVAFALKETSAGRAAAKTVGYMGAPVQAVVRAQERRHQSRLELAERTEAERRDTADRAHRESLQRSQLRISRARARVTEAAARRSKGPSVAESAKAKAASGRFSDFSESEVRWAESNPDALRAAIKGAA